MTTTEKTQAPSYEDFLTTRVNRGRWAGLAAALTPGIPVRVPELVAPVVSQPKTDEQRATRSAIYSMKDFGRRNGFRIAVRSFGSEVWVCRLKDEDAK